VKEVIPWVDGARLDDVVDYFTYVLVPCFFALQMGMLPAGWDIPVVSAVAIASGYGFAQTTAKTADHFFTGFPSYWNIVVFYLYALRWPPVANALCLLALAIAVFIPIRYVYPSRTTTLRALTVSLGLVWAGVLLYALLTLQTAPRWLVTASLAFPAYYLALSLYLHARHRS
jgi:phosphatidylcholine synthase